MSRGFVKEDDQEEIPIVPQRAYLPDGVTNFVTQSGINQLLEEKKALISERDNLNSTDENEKRIALNHINAKLNLLSNRISSAKIVDNSDQPEDEIRFGAIVNLRTEASKELLTFQIVGVDEADISRGKISFISPLAKILINKKRGDKVAMKRTGENVVFEILGIDYQ